MSLDKFFGKGGSDKAQAPADPEIVERPAAPTGET